MIAVPNAALPKADARKSSYLRRADLFVSVPSTLVLLGRFHHLVTYPPLLRAIAQLLARREESVLRTVFLWLPCIHYSVETYTYQEQGLKPQSPYPMSEVRGLRRAKALLVKYSCQSLSVMRTC
jgi:hypothetical protein